MSTFEELFNTSTLDVIVPVASVGFPTQEQEADADASSAWLNKLDAESIDRKTAFFGKVHYIAFLSVHYSPPRYMPVVITLRIPFPWLR